MLVLASLAAPSLTLVCECACSCMGVSYVELLKFEGGTMVDIVLRQYFHLRKCACSAACVMKPWEHHQRRSCANRFLVGLANVP